MGRPRYLPAAIAALALAVSACTSSGATSAPAAPPSPSATPTNPYQQTWVDTQPCPPADAPGLPAGTGCVTSAVGDLDGDGTPDRFVVYARLANRMPASWWAEAIVDGNATPAMRLPFGQAVGGDDTVSPRAVGAADANGDGHADAFVMLSAELFHSGAQPIDAIYDVRDGRITAATSGGRLFLFRTGGISRYGQGAVCGQAGDTHTFTLGHVEQVPGAWAWTKRIYDWRGLTLMPGAASGGRLPANLVINDPRIFHFYRLICGSLQTS
jgi:hypothetical protein